MTKKEDLTNLKMEYASAEHAATQLLYEFIWGKVNWYAVKAAAYHARGCYQRYRRRTESNV